MTVEFAPTTGIPRTSFDGRSGPAFNNATWFNIGNEAEARARWDREDRERNEPKARRLARRERAEYGRVWAKWMKS